MGEPVWSVIALLGLCLAGVATVVAAVLRSAWLEQQQETPSLTMEGYYGLLIQLYVALESARLHRQRDLAREIVQEIRQLRSNPPFANSEQTEP